MNIGTLFEDDEPAPAVQAPKPASPPPPAPAPVAAPAPAPANVTARPPVAAVHRGGKTMAHLQRGGKGMMMRHRRVLRDNILGITKPGIRRLCRRAGIKRIAGTLYEHMRQWLRTFLTKTLLATSTLAQHSRRKTIMLGDLIGALRQQDITFYSEFE